MKSIVDANVSKIDM